MHSLLCDIPVHVEPELVIVATVYAVVFATTTCGLAICSYIHIFGRLGPSAAILLAVALVLYTLNTVYWVTPLIDAIQTHLRTLVIGGDTSFASQDDIQASPSPVLMCATPGVLAISILVGEAILWWRVCVVWAGNRVVKGICAVSLFVTVVFVGVTIGRLEIMKSPSTRLAVMFFIEPDGIGTAVSVFVSNVVAAALLATKIRKQRKYARLVHGSRITHRLKQATLWNMVAGTFAGASWVAVIAFRRQIWTTFRNDTPTWSFWNFALFVTTVSCLRVPTLVWWLPRSFTSTDDAACGEPASYSRELGYQAWTIL